MVRLPISQHQVCFFLERLSSEGEKKESRREVIRSYLAQPSQLPGRTVQGADDVCRDFRLMEGSSVFVSFSRGVLKKPGNANMSVLERISAGCSLS